MRSYEASNLPNFRISAYFPHTKPLKRTFRWLACSPWVTSQNDYDFQCGRRSKGVPTGRDVFLRLSVGKLGTPKFPKFSPMANGYTHAECYGASDLDQRYLKTRSFEDGCNFPLNIFASTPKITPKPHFGRPFNAKPIIHGALSKSHVNGATKLKLYSYVGIGKYLREWGVSKFFR